MVMNTLQLGLRRSSLPSKVKLRSLALTASWISITCCATTDSTCTTAQQHAHVQHGDVTRAFK